MFTHGGKTKGDSLWLQLCWESGLVPHLKNLLFFRLRLLLGKWLYSPCRQIDTFQLTALQVTFHRTLRMRKIKAKMDVILVLLLF